MHALFCTSLGAFVEREKGGVKTNELHQIWRHMAVKADSQLFQGATASELLVGCSPRVYVREKSRNKPSRCLGGIRNTQDWGHRRGQSLSRWT
jgi:hypothetical protein